MNRDNALRILLDNMSAETDEHIAKFPHLQSWIIDSMIEHAQQEVKKYGLANVGKRFWITDKMEVVLLCERCDAPTTKVIIEHQKVVSEKEVECDCGEDIYDDDGY